MEILRHRQGSVNLFSEAETDLPSYIPSCVPKRREAAWATQDPAHRRANEAEEGRRWRNGLETAFLNMGQLALQFADLNITSALRSTILEMRSTI